MVRIERDGNITQPFGWKPKAWFSYVCAFCRLAWVCHERLSRATRSFSV